MKIVVSLAFEEGDPQHGSTEPSSFLLRFADGTSLTLSHDQAQAHVDPIKFGIGAKGSSAPSPRGSTS